MIRRKVWRVRQADPALQYIFRQELGISAVLARLLVNRGIATAEEARGFLTGSLDQMYDPFGMADMAEAVSRIRHSLARGEKVLVYGDYDADGTTATALLVKVLQSLGGQVGYYVPHRMEEGYGLHLDALRRAGREGYKLVITVDCGISSVEEIASNKDEEGPDVIITDHHEPPEELPGAVAVINPKRADCPYRFKELAGVGVALKLAQALLEDAGPGAGDWIQYLDLACLGTVADIVPLTGENRIIVRYGLPSLATTNSPGLKALMQVAGVKPDSLGTREVGFALAPRLNAAGRIGDASLAVDLFLTADPAEAAGLAANLNRGNQERQRIESLVLAEAMGMLDADPGIASGKVIVLASEGWHSGVVGIVASRLVERFYRPVLMIALENGQGKGSGRSVPGLHLYDALNHCDDHLVRFGGHAQAVGFTISQDKVEGFRRAINGYAGLSTEEGVFTPGIDLDALVTLDEINDGFIREIQMLEPFGHCNPGPVLACRGVKLVSFRKIGRNGGHLKMMIRDKDTFMDGIAFKMASCAGEIAAASEVDVAFFPSFNEWNGRRSIQLEVKDIRPTVNDWETCSPACEGTGADDKNFLPGALESLKRIGPLAHMPEFIAGALKRFAVVSPNFVFAGDYLKCFVNEIALSGNRQVRAPQILGPGSRDRMGSLLALAGRNEGSMVLVNSPVRAVETALLLNRSGVRAAFMHAGVPDRAGDVREAFASGLVRSVVCTYECLGSLDIKPGTVILYDVPYSPEGLESAAGEGALVYGLFGEEDFSSGIEFLESMAPGRDRLADLYTYLSRLKEPELLDPEHAAGFMRARGLTRAGIHTIAFGLSVFSDLGLLKHRPADGGYHVFPAKIDSKRDINLSAVFRAGQDIKAAAGNWWESLGLASLR